MRTIILCLVCLFCMYSCDSNRDKVYMLVNKTDMPVKFYVDRGFGLPDEMPSGGQAQLLPRYFWKGHSMGVDKKDGKGKITYKETQVSLIQTLTFFYGDSIYVDINSAKWNNVDSRYSPFYLTNWMSGDNADDDKAYFTVDEEYLSSLTRFAVRDSIAAKSYVKRAVGSVE